MSKNAYANIAIHFESFFSLCGVSSILTAAKADPDTFTFAEAMSAPDREQFIEAAIKEIRDLEVHGAWTEVPLSEANGEDIVLTTWVFTRKRTPDGRIKKWKARLCLRGDLMRGVNNTFAPVVAFSTVRVFLVISIIAGWKTCSIDFSNAFIQAKRTQPIFVHVPKGFCTIKENHVLKLVRSLYGARDAPKLWLELLFKAFKEYGLTQSMLDPCLWLGKNLFLICFVDEVGICYKSDESLNSFYLFLEEKKFVFTKETTFEDYLGIQYVPMENGSIHLLQTGLI